MYNLEIFLLCITLVLIISLIWVNLNLKDARVKIKTLEKNVQQEKIDFKYADDAIKFLDKIINEKYRYYMYVELIPIYLDKKIPEKKLIQTIKEKIYVSVVGGLTQETKKSILTFFNEKGIEIYIHEKIMILINETDFKASDKSGESFRDIKDRNISAMMP
jgi:hypothetical protein